MAHYVFTLRRRPYVSDVSLRKFRLRVSRMRSCRGFHLSRVGVMLPGSAYSDGDITHGLAPLQIRHGLLRQTHLRILRVLPTS